MYCPPNYLNWHEVKSLSLGWATRLYLADAYEVLGEDPQRALTETENLSRKVANLSENKLARERLRLADAWFEIHLIAFWIMNHLDEDFGAAICSPAGGVLKASHPILFHPDQFFYFHLRFPLRDMAELIGVYREYDEKRMTTDDLWGRYTCLDGATGLIKEKNQTARQFTLYFGGGEDDDGGVFERYVRPFLGWYVVWGEQLFPDALYELYDSLGLLNKHWKNPETETASAVPTKKRGPKPSPAKAEFERRYPDGIPDDLSADAIAAELTDAGFPITGRSVLSYDKARSIPK